MLGDVLHRVGFVALSSAGGGVFAIAGVPDEHAATVATLVAACGVVAAGIAWFDSRVEKRLKAHEKAEFEKQDAKEKLEEERHRNLLAEIAHVKELLDIRSEPPSDEGASLQSKRGGDGG